MSPQTTTLDNMSTFGNERDDFAMLIAEQNKVIDELKTTLTKIPTKKRRNIKINGFWMVLSLLFFQTAFRLHSHFSNCIPTAFSYILAAFKLRASCTLIFENCTHKLQSKSSNCTLVV